MSGLPIELKVDDSCDPNEHLSALAKKAFSKYNNSTHCLLNENQAYVDDQINCEQFKGSTLTIELNKPIEVDLNVKSPDDDTGNNVKIKIKRSLKVKDIKNRLLNEKWDSKPLELDIDNIEIRVKDKILSDDDYFYSYEYKTGDDYELTAIIKGEEKAVAKYYFQFPEIAEATGLELNTNATFQEIKKMKEFAKQDYSFFDKEESSEPIEEKSKISDYNDAQKPETPLYLKINFLIEIKSDSSSEVTEKKCPLSLNQKVCDVLNKFANDNENRRSLFYEDAEVEPDTELRDIDYEKGEYLVIKILPRKYQYTIESADGKDGKSSIDIYVDMTIKDVISKIREDRKEDDDLVIYKGDDFEMEEVSNSTIFTSVFPHESDIFTIKKVDPKYNITFGEKNEEKSFKKDATVKDLLKEYKPEDKRKPIALENEGKILDDDQVLSKLPTRNLVIKELDPIYTFKMKDSDVSVKLSIQDGCDYEEVCNKLIEKIDEIKNYDSNIIDLKANNGELSEFTFGPGINIDEPIIISISDPEYEWKVIEADGKENKKSEIFTLPADATVKDAIKYLEDKYKNKFIVSIEKKSKKESSEPDLDENVYENLYSSFLSKFDVYIHKNNIEYTFNVEGIKKDIKKRFSLDDEIGEFAKFLNKKNRKLIFNEKAEASNVNAKDLIFKYKNNEYEPSQTFKDLKYDRKGDDKIVISRQPEKYPLFSLNKVEHVPYETGSTSVDKIKEVVDTKELMSSFENFLIFHNFDYVSESENKVDLDSNTIIDLYSYKTKIGFRYGRKSRFICINDDNISVDELKVLMANKALKDKIVGPDRICLKYNDKEISDCLFKDIGYKDGDLISFELKQKECKVKFFEKEEDDEDADAEIKSYKIEDYDSVTLADIENEINDGKSYTFMFEGKKLSSDDKLADLHLRKSDCIIAKLITDRFLKFDKAEYKLDKDFPLNKPNELKTYLEDTIGIDVDNCRFKVGEKEYTLSKFKDIPKSATVKVIKSDKKYSNFEDKKYNDKFSTYDTIGMVYEQLSKKGKYLVKFQSDGKIIPKNKKLFQIKQPIKVIRIDKEGDMKDVDLEKTFKYPKEVKGTKKEGTERFDLNVTGALLRAYSGEKINDVGDYQIFLDGVEINDDDFIHEFGKEITFKLKKSGDTKAKDKPSQVTFLLDERGGFRLLDFRPEKKLSDYQKELSKKGKDPYIFFSLGKLLYDDNDTLQNLKDYDEDDRVVNAYKKSSIVNFKKDDDVFNKSAKCAQRFEKPRLKIDKIAIESVDNDEEEPIVFEIPVEDGMNVKDLTKRVAKMASIPEDKISLVIMFATKDGNDLACLGDDEIIAEIIQNNPGKTIKYKSLKKAPKKINKRLMKNFDDEAKKCGLVLSEEQINDIYRKADGILEDVIATFKYIQSK